MSFLLCVSPFAFTDCTQEFEYRYRKDHRLLGNPFDIPSMPFRKQDDNTTSAGAGAFGRAMRKLTPRKASLVNLMKGKGWNKSDEAKSGDVSERNQETSSDYS
jgi:predicted nucleic acid-binding Zn ribbon protein